jgi:hypothetical protein
MKTSPNVLFVVMISLKVRKASFAVGISIISVVYCNGLKYRIRAQTVGLASLKLKSSTSTKETNLRRMNKLRLNKLTKWE